MRGQPALVGVGDGEHAPHALHRLVDDGQAQAGAGGRGAGRVAAEKRLGQLRQLVRRHARAVVAQAHQHPVLAGLDGDVDKGRVGVHGLAVAAGVFQQVGDDARQLHLVGHHVDVVRDGHGDLQLAVVLHRVHAGGHHGMQVHHGQRDVVGPRVVQEFVDGGVQLHDVGHHVFAGNVVLHAHLGFQAQARQRGAQVVRDAGQHHGALLLQLGQFLRHAVEADVDLADLAGHGLLVELAGGKVAIAHAVGGVAQLLEGAVDQARDHGRAGQRQQARRAQPDQPGAATGRGVARLVQQDPVRVLVDGEADPQAFLAVDAARQDGVGPQARGQQLVEALVQLRGRHLFKAVAGLARLDAHAFLVGHGLDQRHPGDGVRVLQRRPAEVDQRGDLLGRVQRARLEFERPQRLQPGQDTAQQQQGQQEEGAPEEVQTHPGAGILGGGRAGIRGVASKHGRA